MLNQLRFIRAGMETKRYHIVPTLGINTVAHHSFGVAWLAMLLAQPLLAQKHIGEHELLLLTIAALSHDLPEHVTGDVPFTAKRELQLRSIFGDYENALLTEIDLAFTLADSMTRILEMADCMDGALFCLRERQMGNKLIVPTYANYMNAIGGMDPQAGNEMTITAYIMEEWEKANVG